MTDNQILVEQLQRNWRRAELSAQDRTMLNYVDRLTLRPWEMVEEDVVALRDAGFSDTAILDINQVTGYYAYVNRLADGLGVELEPYWHSKLDEQNGGDEPY